MPKAPLHDAISRQWDLLKMLGTHGVGQSALDLTKRIRDLGYPVTKRTVERDLERLSGGLFGLQCDTEFQPYLWSRMPSSVLNLPEGDMADALSLALAEDLLRKLAPVSLLKVLEPKFTQAQSRLNAVQKNRYAQWKDRVRYVAPTLPFLPPKVDRRILGIVEEAILDECQIKVTYSSREASRASKQTLHPLALVQYGPIAYLVAIAGNHTEPILYALHRVHSAETTSERARRPKGFSLDEFLAKGGLQFGQGSEIRLRAEVSSSLACYLEESPLSAEQQLKPRKSGQYGFEVTIKDSWQLQFWILSQGVDIVVEQPAALRNRIRDILKSSLDAYRTA